MTNNVIFNIVVSTEIHNNKRFYTATCKGLPWFMVQTHTKKEMQEIVPELFFDFIETSLQHNVKEVAEYIDKIFAEIDHSSTVKKFQWIKSCNSYLYPNMQFSS